MDVAVTEFRARLSEWLARVQEGNEVVITDRGIPIARMVAIDATPTLTRLTDEGIISRPTTELRRKATNRKRPRPQRSVAEQVSEHRR